MQELIPTGLDTSTVELKIMDYFDWTEGHYHTRLIGEEDWFEHFSSVYNQINNLKTFEKYVGLVNVSRTRINEYLPIWMSIMSWAVFSKKRKEEGYHVIKAIISSMAESKSPTIQGYPQYLIEENLLWKEWNKLVRVKHKTGGLHDQFLACLAGETAMYSYQEVSSGL